MSNLVITISRQFGSGGREIGELVAKELGIAFYDRELIAKAAAESGYSEKLFDEVDKKGTSKLSYSLSEFSSAVVNGMWQMEDLYLAQSKVIRDLADKESCVIIGRCADHILRDHPNHFGIFVRSTMEERVRRVSAPPYPELKNNKSPQAVLEKMDKQRATYYNYYTGKMWGKVENYDLCLNAGRIGIENSVKLILDAVSGLEK